MIVTMKVTDKILYINRLETFLTNKSVKEYDVYNEITQAAQKVSHSDRASLFIFNHDSQQLETHVAQGLPTKIEVMLGEGIVGKCAQTKKAIIENDVDASQHFNATIDLGSGYVTTDTLAVPILDKTENLLGVIQVLNKEMLHYNEKDEQLLLKIAKLASDYISKI